jgi:hypothetical protein
MEPVLLFMNLVGLSLPVTYLDTFSKEMITKIDLEALTR